MTKEEVFNVIKESTGCYRAMNKVNILDDLCIENTRENRRELTNIINELKEEGKIDTYYMTYDEGKKLCGRGYALAE